MNISRKIVLVLALVLILPSALSAQNYQELDEDTVIAFGLSFQAYMTGVMTVGFGGELPGCSVEMRESGAKVVFQNMSLDIMQPEDLFGYTTISGFIDSSETELGADMEADLTFAGGSVKQLKWSVTNYEMGNSEVVFLITADGRKYRMSYSDFMDTAQ